MLLTQRDDLPSDDVQAASEQRLYVSWQDPDSREIRPVGILSARPSADGVQYEFRYLRDARRPPFTPFVGFPSIDRVYTSDALFAMFENRLMPPRRPDYGEYVSALGLPLDAAPFELLAASFGIRATDTVEVFQLPTIDPETGLAECRFLARGVRHIDGAEVAISGLAIGDRLTLVPDTTNPVDTRALRLETTAGQTVGFAPAYLVEFLHQSAASAAGFSSISVIVDGCDPSGPFHLRLLCRLEAPVPPDGFGGPAFEPIVSWSEPSDK